MQEDKIMHGLAFVIGAIIGGVVGFFVGAVLMMERIDNK